MLELFYHPNERATFVNRRRELTFLDQFRERVERDEPQRLALWGQRRIGKTLLLKEFTAHLLETRWPGIFAYIDLEPMISSPENFTLTWIGHILHWYRTRWSELPPPLFDLNVLQQIAVDVPERTVRETVAALAAHLSREKPDYHALLTLAFEFPNRLSLETQRPLILILDEFPELLALERYPGLRPLSLFRGLMQHGRVSYILAGSAMSLMAWMVDNANSPLFAQLDRLTISILPAEDTRQLIRKVATQKYDAEVEDEIIRLSGGHPYYVRILVRALEDMIRLQGISPSREAVRYAFLAETLAPEGRIASFCRYVYEVSLRKATGYGTLKAVLQLLAEQEETPARLARRLKASQPAVWSYLRRLEEVDLIVKDDGTFHYRDPVLQFWVAATTRGVQVGPFPHREELAGLIHLLEERFQRASTELGMAKEFEVRELLRRFDGQTVEGAWLGTDEPVRLPHFHSVEPWRSPDGQIEIDARAANSEVWLVEVKWRVKVTTRKEMEQFLQVSKTLPHDRLWIISRSGFSASALKLARERGVLLSDAEDWERLHRLLQAR